MNTTTNGGIPASGNGNIDLNGSSEETLGQAQAAADAALANREPADYTAGYRRVPTYSDAEILEHAKNGTDYSQAELDWMTDAQYARYRGLVADYKDRHPTAETLNARLKPRLELADQLGKMAQYAADETADDPDFKEDHDEAAFARDYFLNRTSEFTKMPDSQAGALAERVQTLYDAASKRRGFAEKTWDALVRGSLKTVNMIYQGCLALKPGELTDDDVANLRGSRQTDLDIDIENPQGTGRLEDINSVGDAVDWFVEKSGENATRVLVATGAAIAGATLMPVAPWLGAILFGTAGTMAMNTGEAVQDQMDENRNDGDIRKSRGWALAQGLGYSILDGAFGVSAWGGKLWSAMLRKAGVGGLVKGATVNKLADLSKKAVLKEMGKDLVWHGMVGEGLQEMGQSQLVGRGIRWAQTGSIFRKNADGTYETSGEAWKEALNEFAGGAAAGLSFGLLGGGASHVDAKHTVYLRKNLFPTLANDKTFQEMPVYAQMLVVQKLYDDAALATTNVMPMEEKDSYALSNAQIEAELRRLEGRDGKSKPTPKERLVGQSARAYLDLFKSQYSLDDLSRLVVGRDGDAVVMADGSTFTPTLDAQAMAGNAEEGVDKDTGRRYVTYTNPTPGNAISVTQLLDEDGKPTGKYLFNNDPSRKSPVYGENELVCGSLEEAFEKAKELDAYNQWRQEKNKDKEAVVRQVFANMFGSRGVNLKLVDRPTGSERRGDVNEFVYDQRTGQAVNAGPKLFAGFTAEYDPKTRTVEIALDNIDSLGDLYTVLMHERSHEDIAEFLLKSGKFMKIVGGKTSVDWDAFGKARDELFAKVDGAEAMSARFRPADAKLNAKTGKYESASGKMFDWGRSAGVAGEEMVVERNSIRELAEKLRRAERGIVGGLLDKVRAAIGMKMALDMRLDPAAIMANLDGNVASEMNRIFENGYLGEPAPEGFVRDKPEGNGRRNEKKPAPAAVPGAKDVADGGGVQEEVPHKARKRTILPQLQNGGGEAYAYGTDIRRADGTIFTKTALPDGGYAWRTTDNRDFSDEEATQGGFEKIYQADEPVEDKPTEGKPAETKPIETPTAAKNGEGTAKEATTPDKTAENTPRTPQEASVELEKSPEQSANEAPATTAPEAAQDAPQSTKAAPESVEAPNAANAPDAVPEAVEAKDAEKPKNTDNTTDTEAIRKMPAKTRKAVLKQLGLSSVTPEQEDRWMRLDELPDGTVVSVGGKRYRKKPAVKGEADRRYEGTGRDRKNATQMTLARTGKFTIVSVAEPKAAKTAEKQENDDAEVNRLVDEYVERERKREAEEARDATADAHIEEKETDAERFARYDRIIDEVIDRELKDDVSDAQRKTIKELTRQYGETVEIRPSPVFKGYNIVRFDDCMKVLAPDGHVMTHDEVMALGAAKKETSDFSGKDGNSLRRAKSVLTMPQLAKASALEVSDAFARSLGGTPSNYKGLSDDKLMALAFHRDDPVALHALWDKWAAKDRLPKWFADRGVKEADVSTMMKAVWKAYARAAGESLRLEYAKERIDRLVASIPEKERGKYQIPSAPGTPLGRTVNAESLFYSIANEVLALKENADYHAERRAAYEKAMKEAEAERDQMERQAALRRAEYEVDALMTGVDVATIRRERAIAESAAIPERYKKMAIGELLRKCFARGERPADPYARQEAIVRAYETFAKNAVLKSVESRAGSVKIGTLHVGDAISEAVGILRGEFDNPKNADRIDDIATDEAFKAHLVRIAYNMVNRRSAELAKSPVKSSLERLRKECGDAAEAYAAENDNADDYVADSGDVDAIAAPGASGNDEAARVRNGVFANAEAAVENILLSGVLSARQRTLLESLMNAWREDVYVAYYELEEAKARGAHQNTVAALERRLKAANETGADDNAVLSRAAEFAGMKNGVYRAQLNRLIDGILSRFVNDATYAKMRGGNELSRQEKDYLGRLRRGMFSEEDVSGNLAGISRGDEAPLLGYSVDEIEDAMAYNGDEAMRWCVRQIEDGVPYAEIVRKISKEGALKGLGNAQGVLSLEALLGRAYEEYGWIDPRAENETQRKALIYKLITAYRGDDEVRRYAPHKYLAQVGQWLSTNGVKIDHEDLAKTTREVLKNMDAAYTKAEKSRAARVRAAEDHAAVSELMDRYGGDEEAVRKALAEAGNDARRVDSMMTHWRAGEKVRAERAAKEAARGEKAQRRAEDEAAAEARRNAAPAPKTNEDVAKAMPYEARRAVVEQFARLDGDEYMSDAEIVDYAVENLGMDRTTANTILNRVRPDAAPTMTDAELAARADGTRMASAEEVEQVAREAATGFLDGMDERDRRDVETVQLFVDKFGKENAREALSKSGLIQGRVNDMLTTYINYANAKKTLGEDVPGASDDSALKRKKSYLQTEPLGPEDAQQFRSGISPDSPLKRWHSQMTVDDADAAFISQDGMRARGKDPNDFGIRSRKRDERTVSEANDLLSRRTDFERARTKAENGETAPDYVVRAIGIDYGQRLSDNLYGHLSEEEIALNEAEMEKDLRAAARSGSETGASLNQFKYGFDLRMRSTAVYMREQLRARYEREAREAYGPGGDIAHAADIEAALKEKDARLKEMEAKMAGLYDAIDKANEERDARDEANDERDTQRRIDEAAREARQEGIAIGRKMESEEARTRRLAEIDRVVSEFGADADAAELGTRMADSLGDLFAETPRFAGNPEAGLDDRKRAAFAGVLKMFGGDADKAKGYLRAKYENFAASMEPEMDQYLAELDRQSVSPDGTKSAKAKRRREIIDQQADKAPKRVFEVDVSDIVDADGNVIVPELTAPSLAEEKAPDTEAAPSSKQETYIDRIRKRVVDAAVRARESSGEAEALQAVGEFARNWLKLFVVMRGTDRDAAVAATLGAMNGLGLDIAFDEADARDAILGRGDFKPMSREGAKVSLAQAQKAIALLEAGGSAEEAARIAGIEYKTDAQIREELERRIGSALNKRINVFESRINENEDEELRRQIHDLAAALRDVRSETPTETLLERYLNLAVGMKDYRRQRGLLDRIRSRIEMYERKLANNDFEPAPRRENPDDAKDIPNIQYEMWMLERLRERFKHELNAWRMKKEPWLKRQVNGVIELLGEAKAVVGSMDISSFLRQGGQMTFAHPLLALKNLNTTRRIFFSKNEDNALAKMKEIWRRPNAKYYLKAMIDFTDWGDNASNKEDSFLLNRYRWFTRNKLVKMGIEASERAFSMYLNMMRADLFDAMIANSPRTDPSMYTDEELKAIGNYINVASQRGTVDAQDKLGKALSALNAILWSPRNILSRWQFITNTLGLANPLASPYGTQSHTMRKMFAKETARYLTGVASAIVFTKLMADLFRDDDDDEPPQGIEFDPRSSDFLKVRIGNTRLDFLSGLQPMFVFASRILSGSKKNLRGETYDLSADDKKNATMRFIRSKFSPMMGFFWDTVVDRETFDRQDISYDPRDFYKSDKEKIGFPRYVAKSVFCPLSVSDVIDQLQEGGVGKTFATALMTALGAGVKTFDPYSYKQMSGDFHYFKRLYKEAQSNEERARLMELHPMLKRMGSIDKAIKDVNRIRSDIRKLDKQYKAIEKAGVSRDSLDSIDRSREKLNDVLERFQKLAINLMAGFKRPADVD